MQEASVGLDSPVESSQWAFLKIVTAVRPHLGLWRQGIECLVKVLHMCSRCLARAAMDKSPVVLKIACPYHALHYGQSTLCAMNSSVSGVNALQQGLILAALQMVQSKEGLEFFPGAESQSGNPVTGAQQVF